MGNSEKTLVRRVRCGVGGLTKGWWDWGTVMGLPTGKQILNIASKIRMGSSYAGGVDCSRSPKKKSLLYFKNPLASKN